VCGGAGLFDDPAAGQSDGGGCCTPAPQLVQLGIGAPTTAAVTKDSSSGGCC
jgi:hypothetical protein